LRYFFRRYIPPFTRVLLVESGSRGTFDTLAPLLYQIHGEAMELDLITCHQTTIRGARGLRLLRQRGEKLERWNQQTSPAAPAFRVACA
jgi:hypothetical protein